MLKFRTFDFLRCVSVNDRSQFSIQDLWRKLVVPLKHTSPQSQTGDCFSTTGSFCTVNVEFRTHSPGPSELSPARSSASAVSRNEAVPYGSTNTKLKDWLISLEDIGSFREIKKFYLLVNFLVVWMKAQSPQKQMSGTFRWISILHFTLGCQNPKSWIEVHSFYFKLTIQCELQYVKKQCCTYLACQGVLQALRRTLCLFGFWWPGRGRE